MASISRFHPRHKCLEHTQHGFDVGFHHHVHFFQSDLGNVIDSEDQSLLCQACYGLHEVKSTCIVDQNVNILEIVRKSLWQCEDFLAVAYVHFQS